MSANTAATKRMRGFGPHSPARCEWSFLSPPPQEKRMLVVPKYVLVRSLRTRTTIPPSVVEGALVWFASTIPGDWARRHERLVCTSLDSVSGTSGLGRRRHRPGGTDRSGRARRSDRHRQFVAEGLRRRSDSRLSRGLDRRRHRRHRGPAARARASREPVRCRPLHVPPGLRRLNRRHRSGDAGIARCLGRAPGGDPGHSDSIDRGRAGGRCLAHRLPAGRPVDERWVDVPPV